MHCVTSNVIRCSYRPERVWRRFRNRRGLDGFILSPGGKVSVLNNSEKRKEDSSCKVMNGVDSEDLRFGEVKPDIPPHAVRTQPLYWDLAVANSPAWEFWTLTDGSVPCSHHQSLLLRNHTKNLKVSLYMQSEVFGPHVDSCLPSSPVFFSYFPFSVFSQKLLSNIPVNILSY